MIMTIEARQWVDLEVIKFSMSIIRVTLKFNNNSFLNKYGKPEKACKLC